MTLSEVHDNPELLARFLGVPFEDRTEIDRPMYGHYPYTRDTTARTVTAVQAVAAAWKHYRAHLEADYLRHHPYQTWGQFISECLRHGLGIKSKGKLTERLDYARMAHPELYQPV